MSMLTQIFGVGQSTSVTQQQTAFSQQQTQADNRGSDYLSKFSSGQTVEGKITGINKKFPLAMALLVDEMYRAQGSTYRVVIGDPIPWQTFDQSKTPNEWAQWVKEKVYQLDPGNASA